MITEMINGSVDMVELGWMEVEVEHNGEIYTLCFETEERPSSGTFSSVDFADDESEEIANEIGFEITEEFIVELYHNWSDYSNQHFRG